MRMLCPLPLLWKALLAWLHKSRNQYRFGVDRQSSRLDAGQVKKVAD